jgi:DNA mismatch repair ATPase MutS
VSKIGTVTPVDAIEFLKSQRTVLMSLRKKLGYLVIDKEALHELVRISIEYLNMFFLFDLIAYYRSVDILLKSRGDIRAVFDACGTVDASIAFASYLEEVPYSSTPIFHDAQTIHFKDLYHPLIKDAVSNTVENLSGSVLITGSNMSGKTTFIKTVGISVMLSQSLHASFAKELRIPRLMVKSAIRRNESLEEGKSYFFAEIEALLEFMRLSEKKHHYLFLIDEIFRGTNTIERLASSTAVLKHLNANNTVFVTTHDIELQELLEQSFRMFHFSEQVEDGRFFFDYTIREGPCSSGNAIKLLEIMDYPASVTAEAAALAKVLKDYSQVPDTGAQQEQLLKRTE